MSGAELALAVAGVAINLPGLIDVCIQLSDFLLSRLQTYQAQDDRIAAYSARFAIHYDNLKDAIKITQRIASSLDDDVNERLVHILERLRDILVGGTGVLAKYTSSVGSSTERLIQNLRFALEGDKTLSSLLKELEVWEHQFLTRQALINFVRTEEVPQQYRMVRSPPLLQKAGLEGLPSHKIPLLLPLAASTGEELQTFEDLFPLADQFPLEPGSVILRSRAKSDVLVERYELSRSRNSRSEVPELACKLHAAEPELMRILRCSSFFLRDNEAYELHFAIPESYRGATPRSLRSLLLDPSGLAKGPRHALNDRLLLANRLATAIWYVHSGNFVHKSIRPENIVVLCSSQDKENSFPNVIGSAFLAGFDSFRRETTKTLGYSSVPEVELLYRHKSRWRSAQFAEHSMLHDIYSLGVCLLEVGLWESLVVSPDRGDQRRYSPGLRSKMRADNTDPNEIHSWLITTAEKILPRAMGLEFSKIAVACLTCLEGGLVAATGQHGDGETTPKIAVQYMEAVIERLEYIRL